MDNLFNRFMKVSLVNRGSIKWNLQILIRRVLRINNQDLLRRMNKLIILKTNNKVIMLMSVGKLTKISLIVLTKFSKMLNQK